MNNLSTPTFGSCENKTSSCMLSGGDCTPLVRVSVSKPKGLPVPVGRCGLCRCWARLGQQGLWDGQGCGQAAWAPASVPPRPCCVNAWTGTPRLHNEQLACEGSGPPEAQLPPTSKLPSNMAGHEILPTTCLTGRSYHSREKIRRLLCGAQLPSPRQK